MLGNGSIDPPGIQRVFPKCHFCQTMPGTDKSLETKTCQTQDSKARLWIRASRRFQMQIGKSRG